uniref:Ankyrin repeat-containing protein n=1 Tax=Quercus lobata TaxID=97700 RepID=A0A7N2LJE4_QUELO
MLKSKWDAANQFISSDPEAVIAQISISGSTALHIAIFEGHMNIVDELVQTHYPISLHTPKDIKVCMVYLQSYALLPMVETLIQWTVESSVEKLLEEKCHSELSARIAPQRILNARLHCPLN